MFRLCVYSLVTCWSPFGVIGAHFNFLGATLGLLLGPFGAPWHPKGSPWRHVGLSWGLDGNIDWTGAELGWGR